MSRIYLLMVLPLVVLLAACTAFSGLDENATAETTETQGVIVQGVPALTVNHFAGDINVRPGDEGKITANLTRMSRLDDEAEAQAQLDSIVMSFSQQGANVTLDVEGPDSAAEMVNGPSANLELFVPPGAILTLNLGAGDITVEEPQGDLAVNVGSGNSTVTLPGDAAFRLVIGGGAVDVTSEFEGVPVGGVAVGIDAIVGENPTQTLTFNTGAGQVHLQKAN
jgi:hypothetical protein